jgi:hypothetical protein
MKRIILAALVGVLVSGLTRNGYAKDREPLPNFKQLCIADGSTGFNWVNGGWQRANFKPKKYIISKITPPENIEEANKNKDHNEFMSWHICHKKMIEEDERQGLSGYRRFNACLKVQQVGKKHYDFKACDEVHIKFKGMKIWRIKISCDDLKIDPNGYFHMAYIHSNLEAKPKDDYKDSLSVSVGKCADISN